MDAKIDEKTMRFRNLRFLVFYKEYNVKIVFLHDQACRKSINNQSKIDAKTRLEKVCKFEAKVSQKGAKMEPKMHPKCPKGAKGEPKGHQKA